MPIVQVAGWMDVVISYPPLGFDPWALQPVVSYYTDYVIAAHDKSQGEEITSFRTRES